MKIGNLTTESNIFLAPLHRFNDPAFLNLCSKMGAGIVFTGMVSSYKIVKKGIDFKIIGDTKPIAIQIFGSDEEIMEETAKVSSDFFDLIDINLGCPSRKVFESGSGSALLSDLKKLRKIIRSVVKNASVPVSAKIRSGINKRNKSFIEVGKLLEEEGISMITLHPRTVDMGFSGKAEWEEIRVLKESVKIPVIGSGDIRNYLDAERMIKETGCDGVMIGRAAIGNPWIFMEIKDYLYNNKIPVRVSLKERIETIKLHAKLLLENFDENYALIQMKLHVPKYLKGYSGINRLNKILNGVKSIKELFSLLEKFKIWI